MTLVQLRALLSPVMETIAACAVEPALGERLNREFPADGPAVKAIAAACHEAIANGWMCVQGGAGRRFGRVIEPAPETHNLSVDVVDLTDIVGPHHRHPNGEVCLVLPMTPGAKFDGVDRGWCVYGPNSAHRPTVKDGRALVLYLLPAGAIEFTGR